MRRTAPNAGFTLIEVMVALLIMAGIMVTITQILTVIRHDRDRIHNIQESQLAGPAILERIEDDLRAIYTFNRAPDTHINIENRVVSGYDADSIDFVTGNDSLIPYRPRVNEDFIRADINEVGFRLRRRPDNDDFLELYRREDFGVDDEPFAGGRYSLLHDRVKGFDIQVYEEDGVDAEPMESWGSEDDENTGLPARIEISLTIEMAPRLTREQLIIDKRTMVYTRILRFPEPLRRLQESAIVLTIPRIDPPTTDPAGVGGPGTGPDGGEPTTTTSDPFGDGGGGDGGINQSGGFGPPAGG